MAARKSLRANVVWSLAGNSVYAACQWGWIVVLAKFGTPEDVGLLALALAVTAPVFMLTGLQLRAVQATDARHDHAFGEYLSLRLGLTGLGVVAMVLLALAGGHAGQTAAILAMAAVRSVEAISDLFYGLFQQHERMDAVAASLILRGLLALAAIGIVSASGGGLPAALATVAICWLAVLLIHDALRGAGLARLRPTFSPAALRRLFHLALPLGVVTALISLTANVPRYFLERLHGERELGLFAAMASVILAGSVVVNAAGQAAAPPLARHHASGDATAFRRVLLLLLGVAFGLGIGGVVVAFALGRPILTLLYTAEYTSRLDAFVVVMAGGGILYLTSVLGYAITATRRFKIQVPLQASVAASAIAACAVLVPRWGSLGAAWAVVASAAVAAAGSAWVLTRAPLERRS